MDGVVYGVHSKGYCEEGREIPNAYCACSLGGVNGLSPEATGETPRRSR